MLKESLHSDSFLMVKSSLSRNIQMLCFGILVAFFVIHLAHKGGLTAFKDSMGMILAANFALLALIFHYFSSYLHYRSVYYHVMRVTLADEQTLYSYQRLHTIDELAEKIDRCYRAHRVVHFFEQIFLITAIFSFVISFSILSFGHLLPQLMAKKIVVIPMACQ